MGKKPDTAEVIKKRTEAVALRAAGYKYHQIAQQVGYADESGARKAVLAALKQVQSESVDDLRSIQQEALDTMKRKLLPKVLAGELRAMDMLLKVLDREAKLHGLNAPDKVSMTDPAGENPGELRIVVEYANSE